MFGTTQRDISASNVSSRGTATTGSLSTPVSNQNLINYTIPGGTRIVSKTLYAPAEFSTYPGTSIVPNAGILWFNNAPGLPNAVTDSDPNKFVLPLNALIIGGLLTNNGTLIETPENEYSGSITIGPLLFPSTSIGTDVIFSEAQFALINSPGGISVGINIPGYSGGSSVGGQGAIIQFLVPQPSSTNLSIALTSADQVTSGDLALVLSYMIPNINTRITTKKK